MNWDWIKTWSPLGLGIVLLGVAAIALEREQTDGAGALAGVGFLMIGVWLTVVLHDRWHDDDGEG